MPDYPGFGLPLRYLWEQCDGHYPIGAHNGCPGAQSDMLQVRELAMLAVMESLTDKEEWHQKVFDEGIVSKWREEAMAIPGEHFRNLAMGSKLQCWNDEGTLYAETIDPSDMDVLDNVISDNTFDCIIKELRSKAKYYEQSGLVPTLDACASVAKSDRLVSPGLHEALQQAFQTLRQDQASAPDWHPRSNDMVQNLVHPSMYPFVYGRSRAIKEEVVGVEDAVEKWAGKGKVLPKDEWTWNDLRDRYRYDVGGGKVPPHFWSSTYQWLPANVAFQEDGSVRFTSYINNLHPNRYPEIYRTIEKLIQTTLPAWDQCLVASTGDNGRDGAGRLHVRIPLPHDPDDETPANWVPSDPQSFADVEVNWDEVSEVEYNPEWDDESERKWELLRKPFVPEPEFSDVQYAPEPQKRLAAKFAKTGLQVIVKMASIELTPEKPEFPAGGWHIEGQMNESIAATALYYLDSENITTSTLSFRMQTDPYLDQQLRLGQDAYHYLEKIYGTWLGAGGSPCLQNYGSVETRQGRLLAFPNVFQHQVSGFRLEDPTKPGHRRFIALWLVDPTKRIISTANVPPQQLDWWADAAFGSTREARAAALSKVPPEAVALMKDEGLDLTETAVDACKLPAELMDMVRSYSKDEALLPMGLEEAKEHRLKLMEERTAFVSETESAWHQHMYSFCEH